ncbi:polysaccharide biosynthesis/export family protein [Planctomycetota bacterium]
MGRLVTLLGVGTFIIIFILACARPTYNPRDFMPPGSSDSSVPPSEERIRPLVYLIGIGDTLEIFVWKHTDLTRDVIVRPDGMITIPLIGEITATGQTSVEIDHLITKGLCDYLRVTPETKDGLVSVAVKEFAGEKVFVLGEFSKPGVYNFIGETRLMEIVAQAGGFNYGTKLAEVLVIRGNPYEKPQVIKINAKKLLKKGVLKYNIPVQAKDIIYASPTLITDISRFLGQTLAPILATAASEEYLRRR